MDKTRLKTIFRKFMKWIYKAVILFIILSIVSTILFRWIPVPVTPLMLIRVGQQAINGKELRLWKDWTPLEDISPSMQLAVVVTEDQEYLRHSGFDLEAIKKAFKSNQRGKRKMRGGSTISQQTAKNVFLWNGRNWIRKGLEVYFTMLIEIFWSKERILEVYLNIAEMGEGIYGVQAASKYYYGKDCSKLTKREAASIACILPNPRKYSPTKPGSYIQKRINWSLNQMRMWGGQLDFEGYGPGHENDE
ncbi:MAG: monofunctional biosynthetic peptidoglycan transglycosylase [Bacteroidota bacterium]|jgi:monofunctional biosynthetic peptidoglycan transglycosylase